MSLHFGKIEIRFIPQNQFSEEKMNLFLIFFPELLTIFNVAIEDLLSRSQGLQLKAILVIQIEK